MATAVPPGGTYYDRLGVASTASVDEIRAAYRRLARLLHPDAHHGTADSAMASVNEAWTVLSDPVRRASYDAGLQARRLPPKPEPDDDDDVDERLQAEDGWDDAWDELDPREARIARRLGVTLAVTIVVVLIVLAALFFYAFTRSGTLHQPADRRSAAAVAG